MISKVQGPISDKVSIRDHFQIWIKLEGPKTYFSLWTFTLELHTIFTLHHLAIGKQDYKIGVWIVFLGV